jgi:hypothetical protein
MNITTAITNQNKTTIGGAMPPTTGIPSILRKSPQPVPTKTMGGEEPAKYAIPEVLRKEEPKREPVALPKEAPEIDKMPTAVASTGIPVDWDVNDYSKNYQKEINRIKAINPNDPRLPELEAARAEKISKMPTEVKGPTEEMKEPTKGTATLGTLSSKYESSGNPGAISTGRGDIGGKSYGAYQLASNMGSVNKFMDYLKTANPDYYNKLYTAYTKGGIGFGNNFDTAWKQIAQQDPEGFKKLQHDYIQTAYYDPAASKLKAQGFDISKYSPALQNVLWSVAVQHGVGGAVNLFNRINKTGSEADIINALYDERSNVDKYFGRSSDAVKKGVLNRFNQERQDALRMLEEQEKVKTVAEPTAVKTVAEPTAEKIIAEPTTEEPKEWRASDFAGNYQAEIERLKNLDPADPRIAELENLRADKILENPSKYSPSDVAWARDTKGESYTWKAEDYESDYQTEINRLRQENPADPRIKQLEALRADKIMANPSAFDQATKDWAINIDKRDWRIWDYKDDYQAEIDRIKKFDPNDPRIEQLSDARATKILNNPGGYDTDTVKWAENHQEEYADRMALQELNESYLEAEAQTDINTRRAAKAILDYYKSIGLEAGGQAAAAIAQTAISERDELIELEKERVSKSAELVAQQQARRAERKVAEVQAAIQQAKTAAEFQKLQYQLQEAELDYNKKLLDYQRAVQTGGTSGGGGGGTSGGGGVTSSQYQAWYKTYAEMSKSDAVISIINNTYLSNAQKNQMIIDLGLEKAFEKYKKSLEPKEEKQSTGHYETKGGWVQ